MNIVATSTTRGQAQSSRVVTERIRRQMQGNVIYFAAAPEKIDRRLKELDAEWDLERLLQLNSAALSLFGLAMALGRGRGWLALPAAVQSLFLLHGVQGWCPPLPVLRRLGIRTAAEIETERQALRAVRGDFKERGERAEVLAGLEG